MDSLENFYKLLKPALEAQLDLHISQLSLTHTQKCLLRPLAKPVNSRPINQTGEHTQASRKSFTNRTHSNDNVDIPLDSGQIHREDIHLVGLQILLHTVSLAVGYDILHILVVVEVGHIAAVEDVVDVLEHLFVDDLGVDEEEADGFVLDSCVEEDVFDVFTPVFH